MFKNSIEQFVPYSWVFEVLAWAFRVTKLVNILLVVRTCWAKTLSHLFWFARPLFLVDYRVSSSCKVWRHVRVLSYRSVLFLANQRSLQSWWLILIPRRALVMTSTGVRYTQFGSAWVCRTPVDVTALLIIQLVMSGLKSAQLWRLLLVTRRYVALASRLTCLITAECSYIGLYTHSVHMHIYRELPFSAS
jgi:hypothetical protein